MLYWSQHFCFRSILSPCPSSTEIFRFVHRFRYWLRIFVLFTNIRCWSSRFILKISNSRNMEFPCELVEVSGPKANLVSTSQPLRDGILDKPKMGSNPSTNDQHLYECTIQALIMCHKSSNCQNSPTFQLLKSVDFRLIKHFGDFILSKSRDCCHLWDIRGPWWSGSISFHVSQKFLWG